MDFGLITIIRNPQQYHRSEHEVYQGNIDNCAYAEELGCFKHVWTSEHHFLPDAWSPSQLPILAAIAARTRTIRLGTFIYILPHHNPIRTAEDAATVDIISNGRLDLAVGPGGYAHEFEIFGTPFKQRRPRMFEELEIIRHCFNDEEFSYKGKYFEFNNVRMTTKPVQKPFPLWVAAIGEKALVEAAAAGYHLAAGPDLEHSRMYDDALRKAGHNPKDFQRAGLHVGYIAETDEKAWDVAEGPVQHHMKIHFKAMEDQRALNPTNERVMTWNLTIPPLGELRKTGRGPYGPAWVGSPERIIKMLEDELKTHPMNEVVFSLGMGGIDPKLSRRSMELLAKEVAPHFRNYKNC